MKTLKILLVDDHKMIRDGIRSMLESLENKYKFSIDEAADAEEGILKAKKKPDIIIMDYQLPSMSGADAAKAILASNAKARILALSNYNEYMYINKMVKTGVKGFILKNIGPEELLKAIETILKGNNYYSNDVALKLLAYENSSTEGEISLEEDKLLKLLSEREIEILHCIADEMTSDEIAKKLSISKRTVDSHRQNIMNKLDVKSIAGLIREAIPLLNHKKPTGNKQTLKKQ